jgi:hypothetical protein
MNQQNDRPGTPATSQLPTHMRVKGNPHGVKPNKSYNKATKQLIFWSGVRG